MSKREIKGLPNTGRVSMARARDAVRAIKSSPATPSLPRDLRVTPAKTATGKHLVAFRVGARTAASARTIKPAARKTR